MKVTYITPTGSIYDLYSSILEQPHVLIAGATGSGKSVVVNGIIATALYKSPFKIGFILIDPKRVELVEYRDIPHTLFYASEPDTMVKALDYAMRLIDSRYKRMQLTGKRKWEGSDVYVIIDELADLMTTNRKAVQPLIQRIAQVGRAAKVHLICCTQCPLSKVIPTEIKVNFDARIGLRTRNAQDSRNILGFKGCESLPRYGQGYYLLPEGCTLYNIPMISDDRLKELVSWWTVQRPKRGILGRLRRRRNIKELEKRL